MLDDGGEIARIVGQKPGTLCSDVDPTPCGCVLDGGWSMQEHGVSGCVLDGRCRSMVDAMMHGMEANG